MWASDPPRMLQPNSRRTCANSQKEPAGGEDVRNRDLYDAFPDKATITSPCGLTHDDQAVVRFVFHCRESSDGEPLDITAWLAWFLNCLDVALEDADKSLSSTLQKAALWRQLSARPVNERQREVINRMFNNFHGHLTTSKYAKLAKCSNDTALRVIQDLLERGVVVKNPGGGRSTSYRLAASDELPA